MCRLTRIVRENREKRNDKRMDGDLNMKVQQEKQKKKTISRKEMK